jgi:ADP-heptose:LPS heptosyltransferase
LAILLPNSFGSAMLARLAGAKRRIGYHRDGRGFLLTDRVPIKNREENWWRRGVLLREAKDLQVDSAADSDRRAVTGSPPSPRPSPRHGESETWEGEGELPGARVWPGAHAAVRMGANIPADFGPYRPMPLVGYYADLAEAVGCERPNDHLELFTTPDCDEGVHDRLVSLGIASHHPLLVVSPGAKFGASKCWPPDRFAAAADRLIETHDAAVIITCGPGEEPIAREIGSQMRRGRFVFDNPRLSLGELKSLIHRGDLLLCNDAGPRHIAKAFDVPVVTIFGPTHPDWTATSYQNERIVRMDIDCGPCQQKICPLSHHQCMTGISADIVHAACCELLGVARAVSAGRPAS